MFSICDGNCTLSSRGQCFFEPWPVIIGKGRISKNLAGERQFLLALFPLLFDQRISFKRSDCCASSTSNEK